LHAPQDRVAERRAHRSFLPRRVAEPPARPLHQGALGRAVPEHRRLRRGLRLQCGGLRRDHCVLAL